VNRVEELFGSSEVASVFARGYLDYVAEVLAGIDADSVAAFIDELLGARERDARIFFLGNGGSAATASHFVNDIMIGSKSWHRPFRAVSLTDNAAVITAIANDTSFDEIFTQQLRSHLASNDLVVAISVSGNSPNVLAAVEYARQVGARTVALTGFDGGTLRTLTDVTVHVPTNRGEYGPAEDAHMVLDHLVGAFLAQLCASEQ
jgi:D-sedoheptulose 7-phosphate isomerase